MLVQLVWNIPAMKYGSTRTSEDCLLYMRRESSSIGVALFLALATSIIPTAGAILLLSLSELSTSPPTHWLPPSLGFAASAYRRAPALQRRLTPPCTRARPVAG